MAPAHAKTGLNGGVGVEAASAGVVAAWAGVAAGAVASAVALAGAAVEPAAAASNHSYTQLAVAAPVRGAVAVGSTVAAEHRHQNR
jgi:hypothetical protein